MKKLYSQMVGLVGENPLPVYLGIMSWSQPDSDIVLVCSEQTKEVARRTKEKVESDNEKHSMARTVSIEIVENAFSPVAVRSLLTSLAAKHPDAALNYTGGTKVMASHALLAWKDRLAGAFYLEEGHGLFHFDTEGDREGSFDFLTLSDLCDLHGVDEQPPSRGIAVSAGDLAAIARAWFCLPRWELTETPTKRLEWLRNNTETVQAFLGLLSPEVRDRWNQMPLPDSAKAFEKSDWCRLYRFATGVWLEQFLVALITHLDRSSKKIDLGRRPNHPVVASASPDAIVQGQHFSINGQKFESDVLTIVNQRLRYLSATTDQKESLCKSKMFEAIHRSRQIGGGLASSCVVSLAEDKVVANCRGSVGEGQRHTIFGRDDVQAWTEGDGATLLQFLTGA